MLNHHFVSAKLAATSLIVFAIGSMAPLQGQGAPAHRLAGIHFGSNLSDFSDDPIDLARLGAQMSLPIVGPVDFYPTASIHLDRAQWQLSALARLDFTRGRATNPLYLGAGVSHINWDGPTTKFYDVLFWGLKAGVGEYQPFVEMQFLDGIHRLATTRGDFGVQLYVGVNRLLR